MDLELSGLFATPVVRTSLAGHPDVNAARLREIVVDLRERYPEIRDYRRGVTQASTWHSLAAGKDALVAYPEFRALQCVFIRLIEHYYDLVVEAFSAHDAEVAITRASPTLWATVSDHGGFQYSHNHPQGVALAACSLVYYPALGDSPHSGNALLFDNPIEVASYVDSRVLGLLGVDAHKPQRFALTDGDVVIFPSWLRHSTEPYLGHAPRVAIAFNLSFEGIVNRKLQP